LLDYEQLNEEQLKSLIDDAQFELKEKQEKRIIADTKAVLEKIPESKVAILERSSGSVETYKKTLLCDDSGFYISHKEVLYDKGWIPVSVVAELLKKVS